MSPDPPDIKRYSQAFLLALGKSPLIQKPEGLISVAELMSSTSEPRTNTRSAHTTDSSAAKSAPQSATRFGDKELVFGPPRMNFASAQATSRLPEDSSDTRRYSKSPDDPQTSRLPHLERRQPNPRQREPNPRVATVGTDENGPRAEKKPLGRDAERPAGPERVHSASSASRVRTEGGSWRDRSEGASAQNRPTPVKSTPSDTWPANGAANRRGGRDNNPEWMTADAEKIVFTGVTAEDEQAGSNPGDDDIQRFKAQMRRRERAEGKPPVANIFSNHVTPQSTPTPAVPSPAVQQEADSVESFFDMNFDVHRAPTNSLFENPVKDSKPSSEKSRFARFWSENTASQSQPVGSAPGFAANYMEGHGPTRPQHHNSNGSAVPDTMHRIGISDLFNSAARANGHQDGRDFPMSRGNGLPPTQGSEQKRFPPMLSEDDILSAYNKPRVSSASERRGQADPSEEDRAGINRVMEKLAVFGIQPQPNGDAPGYPPMNPHLNAGIMHPQQRDHAPYMPGPPPPHSLPPQHYQQYEKEQQQQQMPRGSVGGSGGSFVPQSLYSNNVNMGMSDDPSSQLTAMIQAASKAKQSQQFGSPNGDPNLRFKQPMPLGMMGGGGGPYHDAGMPPPQHRILEHMGLNGGPPPPGGPPFLGGPPRPHINGHPHHLPPPHFFPNGPTPPGVPFLPPPHMLPPNFQPRPPPHPGMFPGHGFAPMAPPPYPVFMNQQGVPIGMRPPPSAERPT
ncbi:hypothetical protein HDU87_006058 [Geranomyces variabilis]|uniref:Uncharacterized protein n=1 Tax=Geranomyces variabilis TaxID=109894 RepID=A0AAD5TLH4_9FUNG|nr:hypothetical protein HDU87_006058 [Geranomyces variabilis]